MAEVMGNGYPQAQSQPIPSTLGAVYEEYVGNGQSSNLWDEVQSLLNRHSRENKSQTPDFILAQYLASALEAYEQAVNSRDSWYSITQSPGQGPTS